MEILKRNYTQKELAEFANIAYGRKWGICKLKDGSVAIYDPAEGKPVGDAEVPNAPSSETAEQPAEQPVIKQGQQEQPVEQEQPKRGWLKRLFK